MSYSQLQTKAISTGFSQRTSKLSGAVFFDNLFHSVSQTEWSSLSYMVSRLESEYGVKISKQSLDERFNESSVQYIKSILSEVLSEQFAPLYSGEPLKEFRRVLIKDSTKFMTPGSLEDEYKSSGGDIHSRSKSGISIQYEYDLKSSTISGLSVTSGNRNDRTDAMESSSNVEKGDMIIRDLGYFSTRAFEQFIEKEAFFLSRLDASTNVYALSGEQVSFKDIYKSMRTGGLVEKELSVFIGKATRVPVRLILQLVPDEVYEQRIREKTRKSKGQGRGQLTEETKTRCRFTLLITNAEETLLPAEKMHPLYRLRWQIELQFKAWKSVFKIDRFRQIKKYRYLTLLYAKLLLIVINLQIASCLQQSLAKQQAGKLRMLSLNKSLKTLQTLFSEIFSMFRGTKRKSRETAQYILNRLAENHWLESKKKKLCLPEILMLFVCVSKK